METLIDSVARLGWPSVVCLAMLFAFAVAWRRWRREEEAEKELKDAIENSKAAAASGDPDRIHLANKRLQDARKRVRNP